MKNRDILKQCKKHQLKEAEVYGSYKILFRTLVSEPRLKIINLLRKKRKNVSEIMKELRMSQTVASHNLARLKNCGFVKVHIEGKYRYYEINDKTIKPLMELIDEHMSSYCVHILRKKNGRKEKNI